MLWGGGGVSEESQPIVHVHFYTVVLFQLLFFVLLGLRVVVFFSGVQTGLQHVELADPPQEPELPASGLQLQLEAGEDSDNQGEEEVALRKRLPLVSRDPATHQTHRRCSRPIQTRQY